MPRFKPGDRVYIYRKTKDWDHGEALSKDAALRTKKILRVNKEKLECGCVETYTDGNMLTIFEDCLRPEGFKSLILLTNE